MASALHGQIYAEANPLRSELLRRVLSCSLLASRSFSSCEDLDLEKNFVNLCVQIANCQPSRPGLMCPTFRKAVSRYLLSSVGSAFRISPKKVPSWLLSSVTAFVSMERSVTDLQNVSDLIMRHCEIYLQHPSDLPQLSAVTVERVHTDVVDFLQTLLFSTLETENAVWANHLATLLIAEPLQGYDLSSFFNNWAAMSEPARLLSSLDRAQLISNLILAAPSTSPCAFAITSAILAAYSNKLPSQLSEIISPSLSSSEVLVLESFLSFTLIHTQRQEAIAAAFCSIDSGSFTSTYARLADLLLFLVSVFKTEKPIEGAVAASNETHDIPEDSFDLESLFKDAMVDRTEASSLRDKALLVLSNASLWQSANLSNPCAIVRACPGSRPAAFCIASHLLSAARTLKQKLSFLAEFFASQRSDNDVAAVLVSAAAGGVVAAALQKHFTSELCVQNLKNGSPSTLLAIVAICCGCVDRADADECARTILQAMEKCGSAQLAFDTAFSLAAAFSNLFSPSQDAADLVATVDFALPIAAQVSLTLVYHLSVRTLSSSQIPAAVKLAMHSLFNNLSFASLSEEQVGRILWALSAFGVQSPPPQAQPLASLVNSFSDGLIRFAKVALPSSMHSICSQLFQIVGVTSDFFVPYHRVLHCVASVDPPLVSLLLPTLHCHPNVFRMLSARFAIIASLSSSSPNDFPLELAAEILSDASLDFAHGPTRAILSSHASIDAIVMDRRSGRFAELLANIADVKLDQVPDTSLFIFDQIATQFPFSCDPPSRRNIDAMIRLFALPCTLAVAKKLLQHLEHKCCNPLFVELLSISLADPAADAAASFAFFLIHAASDPSVWLDFFAWLPSFIEKVPHHVRDGVSKMLSRLFSAVSQRCLAFPVADARRVLALVLVVSLQQGFLFAILNVLADRIEKAAISAVVVPVISQLCAAADRRPSVPNAAASECSEISSLAGSTLTSHFDDASSTITSHFGSACADVDCHSTIDDDTSDDALQTCTFATTKSNFVTQDWYCCWTCGLAKTTGCCSVCARQCHKGHDVTYAKSSRFFCDCGAGEKPAFPCTSMDPKMTHKGADTSPISSLNSQPTARGFSQAETSLLRREFRRSRLFVAVIDAMKFCSDAAVSARGTRFFVIISPDQLSINLQLSKVTNPGVIPRSAQPSSSVRHLTSLTAKGMLLYADKDAIQVVDTKARRIFSSSTVVSDKTSLKPISSVSLPSEPHIIKPCPVSEAFMLVASKFHVFLVSMSQSYDVKSLQTLSSNSDEITAIEWMPFSRSIFAVATVSEVRVHDLHRDLVAPVLRIPFSSSQILSIAFAGNSSDIFLVASMPEGVFAHQVLPHPVAESSFMKLDTPATSTPPLLTTLGTSGLFAIIADVVLICSLPAGSLCNHFHFSPPSAFARPSSVTVVPRGNDFTLHILNDTGTAVLPLVVSPEGFVVVVPLVAVEPTLMLHSYSVHRKSSGSLVLCHVDGSLSVAKEAAVEVAAPEVEFDVTIIERASRLGPSSYAMTGNVLPSQLSRRSASEDRFVQFDVTDNSVGVVSVIFDVGAQVASIPQTVTINNETIHLKPGVSRTYQYNLQPSLAMTTSSVSITLGRSQGSLPSALDRLEVFALPKARIQSEFIDRPTKPSIASPLPPPLREDNIVALVPLASLIADVGEGGSSESLLPSDIWASLLFALFVADGDSARAAIKKCVRVGVAERSAYLEAKQSLAARVLSLRMHPVTKFYSLKALMKREPADPALLVETACDLCRTAKTLPVALLPKLVRMSLSVAVISSGDRVTGDRVLLTLMSSAHLFEPLLTHLANAFVKSEPLRSGTPTTSAEDLSRVEIKYVSSHSVQIMRALLALLSSERIPADVAARTLRCVATLVMSNDICLDGSLALEFANAIISRVDSSQRSDVVELPITVMALWVANAVIEGIQRGGFCPQRLFSATLAHILSKEGRVRNFLSFIRSLGAASKEDADSDDFPFVAAAFDSPFSDLANRARTLDCLSLAADVTAKVIASSLSLTTGERPACSSEELAPLVKLADGEGAPSIRKSAKRAMLALCGSKVQYHVVKDSIVYSSLLPVICNGVNDPSARTSVGAALVRIQAIASVRPAQWAHFFATARTLVDVLCAYAHSIDHSAAAVTLLSMAVSPNEPVASTSVGLKLTELITAVAPLSCPEASTALSSLFAALMSTGLLPVQTEVNGAVLDAIDRGDSFGSYFQNVMDALVTSAGALANANQVLSPLLMTSCARLLKKQKDNLIRHPRSAIYAALSAVVDIDGYYLESSPCVRCAPKDPPFASHPIDSLRIDSKFTDSAVIVRLSQRQDIRKVTIILSDFRRGRRVKEVGVFTSVTAASDVASLRTMDSHWVLRGRASIAKNASTVCIDGLGDFPAAHLRVEFLELFEMPSEETLHCPRCNRVVTDRTGLCRTCRENAFQCRSCRNINYDSLNAFICNECGVSRYCRYEITVECRPSVSAGTDHASVIAAVEEHSALAHERLEALRSAEKSVSKLLSGEGATTSEGAPKQRIGALQTLYTRECRSNYEHMCRSVKIISRGREFLKAERTAVSSVRSVGSALSDGLSSGACVSCCHAAAAAAMGVLEVVLPTFAASEWKRSCRDDALGLVDAMMGIRPMLTSEAARLRCRDIVVALARDSPPLNDHILALVHSRIDKAITSVAIDAVPVVVQDRALLQTLCAVDDSLWEPRLRAAMDLLLRATASADALACVLIVDELIAPLVGVVATQCAAVESRRSLPNAALPTGAVASFDAFRAALAAAPGGALRALPRAARRAALKMLRVVRVSFFDFDSESWAKKLLVHEHSIAAREAARNLLFEIAKSRDHIALSIIDFTLLLLRDADTLEEAPLLDVLSLLDAIAELSPSHWRYIAARKGLTICLTLIQSKASELAVAESSSLSFDVARGGSLKLAVAILSKLLAVPTVRRMALSAAVVIAEAVRASLTLRTLVVERSKLVDDAIAQLSALCDDLVAESATCKHAYAAALVSAACEGGIDGRAYALDALRAVLAPQDAAEDVLVNIIKSSSQEEYIRGAMAHNPYASTDLGETMRDVKRKICRSLDLDTLLEDDSSIELLVAGKIVSLDLPIAGVAAHVWRRDAPMDVVFRLRGLDGEATEEVVTELPAPTAEEEDAVDAALVSALVAAGAVASLRSLALMSNVYGAIGSELGDIIRLCATCPDGAAEVVRDGFTSTALRRLLDAPGAASKHVLRLLVDVLPRVDPSQVSIDASFAADVDAFVAIAAEGGFDADSAGHLVGVLTLGRQDIAAASLTQIANCDVASLPSPAAAVLVGACSSLASNPSAQAFRAAATSVGFTRHIIDYAVATLGQAPTEALDNPSVVFCLRCLNGLAPSNPRLCAEVLQCGLVPILCALDASTHVVMGPLAEDALATLCADDDAIRDAVQKERSTSNERRVALAKARREEVLRELGMRIDEGGFIRADGAVVEVEDEAGFVCVVCKEGMTTAPSDVLCVYVLTKQLKVDSTRMFVSTTHMTHVHLKCHADALRADRNLKPPRGEWEGATIRNDGAECNNLLPIRGVSISDRDFANAVDNFFSNAGTSARMDAQRMRQVLFDLSQSATRGLGELGNGRDGSSNTTLFRYLLGIALFFAARMEDYMRGFRKSVEKVVEAIRTSSITELKALRSKADWSSYVALATLPSLSCTQWRTSRTAVLKGVMAQAVAGMTEATDEELFAKLKHPVIIWWICDSLQSSLGDDERRGGDPLKYGDQAIAVSISQAFESSKDLLVSESLLELLDVAEVLEDLLRDGMDAAAPFAYVRAML